MSSDDDETLDHFQCDPLIETAGAQVAILRRLLPTYRGFKEQTRARFAAVMKRWCDGVSMPIEMFNWNEGRSADGIMIRAFKGFKIRLYGFERTVSAKRTFLIVEIDPAKKQDKADPKVLSRAKKRADEIGKGK